MNIAIVYSPSWGKYAQIEVFSLFRTNPPPVTVHLVSDSSGKLDLGHICSNGYKVEFIDAESLFKEKIPSKVNVDARFTKYTLYRLLLPEIISVDRLLYLDADALVTGNITGLYHLDMKNSLVAGVVDTGISVSQKQAIGLDPFDIYINGGVILLNLALIRELELPANWLQQANSRRYNCHDQDIINRSCRGRIKTVGIEYNASPSTGLNIRPEDIKIMHWAGRKPWNSTNVPNYHIWKDWADQYAKR